MSTGINRFGNKQLLVSVQPDWWEQKGAGTAKSRSVRCAEAGASKSGERALLHGMPGSTAGRPGGNSQGRRHHHTSASDLSCFSVYSSSLHLWVSLLKVKTRGGDKEVKQTEIKIRVISESLGSHHTTSIILLGWHQIYWYNHSGLESVSVQLHKRDKEWLIRVLPEQTVM